MVNMNWHISPSSSFSLSLSLCVSPQQLDALPLSLDVAGVYSLVVALTLGLCRNSNVDVVRTGFEDVVAQLGGAIGVIEVVVGFLRVEDTVVWERSGSGGRHEDDKSVEELEVVGKVVFF